MAGILYLQPVYTEPQYKDPRAAVLSGSGNQKITDDQIRSFIQKPGMTRDQVLGAALKHGVSEEQFVKATGQDATNVRNYITGQGISYEKSNPVMQEVIPQAPTVKPATYERAKFVEAKQDPIKGTVAGQLNTILDPNSPLMKRAETYANQQMNRRGLLNSSIGTSAAQSSLIDAGLQIATPDAASHNQFGLFNAGEHNKSNQFNSQLGAQVSMFNTNLESDLGKYNTGIAADLIGKRESNATSILNNRESLANNLAIANLDVDTKRMIAGIQARSEDSRFAASLFDTLLKLQDGLMRDNNIPANDKARIFSDYVNTFSNSFGLFDTIEASGLKESLSNFKTSDTSPSNNKQDGTVNGVNKDGTSIDGGMIQNIKGDAVDPMKVAYVMKHNNKFNDSIDPKRILSEQAVSELPLDWATPNILKEKYGVERFVTYAKDGETYVNNIWLYV